jgi:hypothetical protein
MRILKSITGLLTGIVFVSTISTAQPARDRILDDVHIEEKGGCVTIHIGFTFPVRYVRHFPFEKGDELQIQIEPIALGPLEQEAIFDRESLTPPHHRRASLEDVIYEGDIEGGPFLRLLFTREVRFEVGQGADFRSIKVALRNPAPASDTPSCPHLPDYKQ